MPVATYTPVLGALELVEGQSIPETHVNEQFGRRIEQGAQQFAVKDRTNSPPGSPADGDAYLITATATGSWTGLEKQIAYYQAGTGWLFIVPREGMRADVADEDIEYRYSGTTWVSTSGSGAALDADTDGTLAANSDLKVATQKATKTYVDGKVAGLSWKQAVRAATTANGTLATAFENGDTIDGVTLATGDRILLKNQSSAAENGIYTVNASGAPTRATDADSGAELVNASVYVSEGTINADTQWTCTTNATITVGSTSLAFAQLSTAGGGLLAANNLSDVANPATALANLGGKSSVPGIQSVTSSATVTPTFSNDQVNITAQAAGLTLANPTGTAVDGWGLAIRIKDNGTARSITFGSQYRAIGVTLPTTTVVSKTLYLGLIYNAADTKWDVVAVAQEA